MDVRRGGALFVDGRKHDPAGAFAHLREGVLERLLRAQEALPPGLRLMFVEGDRPPRAAGGVLREVRGPAARRPPRAVRRAGPLGRRAPRQPASPAAPYSAGAAVDLTLADADGRELGMGTRMNADPEESGGACCAHAAGISAEAAARREVLGAALTSAGLVNYQTEWCSRSSP